MPSSENIAWACVVWLLVGLALGALIRGRRKSKRRRASPEEVWALRYECERSNSLERENVRLRDQVSRLVIRVWELEDKLKDPRAELTAASEGMGV